MNDLNPTSETLTADHPVVAGRVAAVLVTHGQVATELLAAAETIVGALTYVASVSIGWHDDTDVARREIESAINRVSQGSGVLLLTDMFGGTPTNIAAMFLNDKKIEVITGVNLPMLIKFASVDTGEPLTDVARRVRDGGRDGIYLAGELLTPQKNLTGAGSDANVKGESSLKS